MQAFRKSVIIRRKLRSNTGQGASMRLFKALFVSIFLFGVGIIPAPVAAQTVSPAEQAEIAGPWHGRWTAPEGWIYEAVISLRVNGAGATSGEINWTLRKTPRPAEQGKVGMTGVESVRGNYYANTGTLILEGYEKNDPNGILGLDKYRLIVSENHRTMAGVTRHHNAWNSQFFLSR
jgi:hypothetical protein